MKLKPEERSLEWKECGRVKRTTIFSEVYVIYIIKVFQTNSLNMNKKINSGHFAHQFNIL